jgi:hypothetical protein
MNKKRPPIPAELRRRILIEAGHRCAIPTCRYIEIEVHHIIPWSSTKEHKYEELIALCPNCHSRADCGKIDRKALRIYKANLRYTHDKFSQFEVDTLFDLHDKSPNVHGLIPEFLTLLIKRILDAEYVEIGDGTGGIALGSQYIVENPKKLHITPKGRKFIDSLGEMEL